MVIEAKRRVIGALEAPILEPVRIESVWLLEDRIGAVPLTDANPDAPAFRYCVWPGLDVT